MAEVMRVRAERVSEYPALPTRLQQLLDRQRRAGQFCDVTLSVQDANFNLHRCVLSAFSPHLTGMLNSTVQPGGAARASNGGTVQATTLDLPELTREGVTPVVNFMYTSKLVLTKDNIFAVSLAAGYFQIRELIQECQQYFQEIQQSQGQGVQGHSFPGRRMVPELSRQFQMAPSTRMQPEQLHSTMGTRRLSDRHDTAPEPRILAEQPHTAPGTSMLSQQLQLTQRTRMESEQPHTVPGTRRSSGSIEALSVDSSPGLQSPTSTSQQIYPVEARRNDLPGTTQEHIRDSALYTTTDGQSSVNFPLSNFGLQGNEGFSREDNADQSNLNSGSIVVKQEPYDSWMDSEGETKTHQGLDGYMLGGENHDLDDLDKPFQCMFCPKRLRSKSQLAMHIRRHTGERPHACPLCFTKFHEKWSLTKHMRVHTGEKPYKCTQCPATFADASNRNKHRKRMHGMARGPDRNTVDNASDQERYPDNHTGQTGIRDTVDNTFEQERQPENHARQVGMRISQLFSVQKSSRSLNSTVENTEQIGMRANQLFSVPKSSESPESQPEKSCVE